MNSEEKLGIWKKKQVELGEKIKQFDNHKAILINISGEISRKTNAKLNNLLQSAELKEEISYLDDWIKFYKGRIEAYGSKINTAEKEASRQKLKRLKAIEKETENQIKALFEEKEKSVFSDILKKSTKLRENKIIRFGIPAILLVLLISLVFISKPQVTGYSILSAERTYNESLNLMMNESGNYTWALNKPVDIKSIKATGSVVGNGSVKIYIEKNGERYLIYKNK